MHQQKFTVLGATTFGRHAAAFSHVASSWRNMHIRDDLKASMYIKTIEPESKLKTLEVEVSMVG